MRRTWAILMVSLAALPAGAQSAAELRALLDRGQAAAAYDAARRQPERLGDPEFDFVYGIAAINAGKPGEGVLALERLLLLDPGNEVARVELARGYFLLGDNGRAREEFEAALARNPPASVARVAREYLEALRERELRHRPGFTAYVEAGGGHDSNPRAGVDDPLITLPIFGEVTVPEAGVRASDWAWQAAGGFRATLPVAGRTLVFLGAHAEALRHRDLRDFDQDTFAGSSGFMGQWRSIRWRAGASRAYQRLGRKPYRHTEAGFAEGTMSLGERNAASLALQRGNFSYAGANAVRDSDFRGVAASWRHLLAAPWQPQFEVSANGGRERNRIGRHDLSRDLYGARLGLALRPLADWVLSAGVLVQYSDYREPDLILETTREDRYLAADVGLTWHASAAFSLRADVTEARNQSNLALYEYRRRTAMLKGRYEFR